MRFISTRIHGILDYLVGFLLIAAPWLLGFYRGGPETWAPVILGVMALIYSLITDYELGAIKVLPMPAHLLLDLVSGIVVAASPWIFGFNDFVFIPHVIFGLFEIAASRVTRTKPSYVSASSSRRSRVKR